MQFIPSYVFFIDLSIKKEGVVRRPAIKLEGGGAGYGLIVRPLKKNFFAASLKSCLKL